jgi:hypothetical protein
MDQLCPAATAIVTCLLLLVAGCDDETLGPTLLGRIDGRVITSETQAPVPNANITTNPPTQSVLTGPEGRFSIDSVEAGGYSVEVTRNGYESKSVSIRVREGGRSNAKVLLDRSDEAGGDADSLAVTVVNFYNDTVNADSTGEDSVFVNVEYSAANRGDVTISRYEVYFDIETENGTFSEEQGGDTLRTMESDVGRFRKYIRNAPATDVTADDTFIETE